MTAAAHVARPRGRRGGQAHRSIFFVSDLHLGCEHVRPEAHSSQAGACHCDEAFGRWLDDVTKEQTPVDVVLLGDTFDLSEVRASRTHADSGSPVTEALASLDCVLTSHPVMLDSLARLSGTGSSLHVLPGNHDIELTAPAVQHRLRMRIEEASGHDVWQRVAFHPWVFHVPALLYAEHGNQYHDINAFPTLLWAFVEGDVDRPLAAAVERYSRDRDIVAFVTRAAQTVRRMSRPATARRRERYRTTVLPAYARHVGIDPAALIAIDRQADVSVPAIAARLGRKLVRSLLRGDGDRAGYLHAASPAVHAALASVQQEVPFYVFGHTHVAEERALPGGARYLNSGSWSCAETSQRSAPRPLPYVHVEQPEAGSATAAVLWWDDSQGRPEPAPAAPTPAA